MYYRTLVADCPWQYRDRLKMKDGVARSSSSQYATLTIDQVCTFLTDTSAHVVRGHVTGGQMWEPHNENIASKLLPDGFLWLWITNPFLLDGSGFAVCKEWGYKPKALITWTKGRLAMVKTGETIVIEGKTGPLYRERIIERPGMGRYTRGVTEHLILATRGTVAPYLLSKSVTNWFLAPRGAHSEKPEEAYRRIRRVTAGPYLALFERQFREGFDVVGDQLPADEEKAA